MVKTTIKINEIVKKEREGKEPFWLVDTDQGKMTAWDKKLVDKLEVGKTVEADVKTQGEFKNIRGVTSADVPVETVGSSVKEQVEKPKAKAYSNSSSMYVAYAKDLCIAMVNSGTAHDMSNKQAMDEAIALVKQARDAFE